MLLSVDFHASYAHSIVLNANYLNQHPKENFFIVLTSSPLSTEQVHNANSVLPKLDSFVLSMAYFVCLKSELHNVAAFSI